MIFFDIKTSNKIISQFNSIVEELAEECPSFIWDKLKETNLLLLKKNRKETIEYFQNNKNDIYCWTLSAMSNTAGDLIESGMYNVYAGILNFEGEELFKIYRFLTDKLVENNTVSRQTVDENIKALLQKISYM